MNERWASAGSTKAIHAAAPRPHRSPRAARSDPTRSTPYFTARQGRSLSAPSLQRLAEAQMAGSMAGHAARQPCRLSSGRVSPVAVPVPPASRWRRCRRTARVWHRGAPILRRRFVHDRPDDLFSAQDGPQLIAAQCLVFQQPARGEAMQFLDILAQDPARLFVGPAGSPP